MNKLTGALALAALVAFAPFGFPGEEPAAKGGGTDIEKVKLGEHWYGPDLKVEDLKGRVVLLEFWGFK
jgi:hypothetical protein